MNNEWKPVWQYFTSGKGRRDGLDYLKTLCLIVAIIALCWLMLWLAGV